MSGATGATREGGDRSTGATPGQTKRALDHWCTFNDFRPENRWAYERDADEWAASFCGPTHAIIPRSYLDALEALLDAGSSSGVADGRWAKEGLWQNAENARDAAREEMGE